MDRGVGRKRSARSLGETVGRPVASGRPIDRGGNLAIRTLGIDLASQPATTAACEIDWTDETATVACLEVGVDDARALALIERADACGIDAPFGWPLPFVDMVRRHHEALGAGDEWTTDRRDALRFRRTDHLVRERLGRWPLSVSSDLIAIVAMRCVGLLDRAGVVDRSGDGRVVEVYPALALACWGFGSRGYKSARNRDALADLAKKLFDACPWLKLADGFRERCARSDHAFDALVASLVARAAALGLTDRPGAEDLAAARAEGWIAVPHSDAVALLPHRGRRGG